MPFLLYGGFRHHDSLLSQSEEYPITLYVCIIYVSVFEGMYVLPCADDVQPNYGKVPCACVAIRRVSHNTVCMYIIRIYIGRNVCACYLVRIMSNPIMRRFHVQGCVVAQPRLCYHGHQRPKHVVLRSRSKPLLVDRTDTLLNEPSFVTTTRITAAPNRLESNCRHKIALVLTTCRF